MLPPIWMKEHVIMLNWTDCSDHNFLEDIWPPWAIDFGGASEKRLD